MKNEIFFNKTTKRKFLKILGFSLIAPVGFAAYNIHKNNNKMVTLTAVRPPARFGALKLKGNKVQYFKEKSKMDEGWINGGFFVIKPEFLKYIKNDKTFLEREPLEKATRLNQLVAYKHKGFWQCMDSKRDKDKLEKIFQKN